MSHVERNRTVWTEFAPEFAEWAPRAWAGEFEWGVWHAPESELGALPDVAGMDTIELGCGTAYISAWLARRGARPVGIDITPAQLETARRMLGETVSATEFFIGMLLPTLALNLLLAYPLYGLCRRIFPVAPRERREVIPVV